MLQEQIKLNYGTALCVTVPTTFPVDLVIVLREQIQQNYVTRIEKIQLWYYICHISNHISYRSCNGVTRIDITQLWYCSIFHSTSHINCTNFLFVTLYHNSRLDIFGGIQNIFQCQYTEISSHSLPVCNIFNPYSYKITSQDAEQGHFQPCFQDYSFFISYFAKRLQSFWFTNKCNDKANKKGIFSYFCLFLEWC